MRTIHLFILGIVFSLGCWAQQNGGKFVITGEMACDSMRHTQQAITTLYLVHNEDGREIKIDSVQVKDKRFRFEGIAPKYVDAYFITGFDNGSIQIFLEPGTITIAPFDGRFPAGANIGGTPNNDVLCAYKKVHSRSITQSIARMKNAGASLPEHIRNDEKAFYPYQNAIYFANTLYYETEVMRFVKQHLFASATLFIIKYDLFNVVSTKVLERQFLRAVPKQLHSHPIYMDMVNRIKAGNLKVGAPAPDIAGTPPNL